MNEPSQANVPAVPTSPLDLPGLVDYVGQTRLWTSLRPGDPRAGSLLSAAINGQTAKLSTLGVNPIKVQDIVLHSCEIVDQRTGECIDAYRVVLVTPDDELYYSTSTGVIKSLMALCQFCGMPPWVPARTLRMVEKQTRVGHRLHVLEEISCPQEQVSPPSRKRSTQ